MKSNSMIPGLLAVLVLTSVNASAEVGQKRSKCEEGIGCRDEQKKAPDASSYAPKNDKAGGPADKWKSTSPGLGVGVTGSTKVEKGREPLPGSGGYAGATPAEQALVNEICADRQEHAALSEYQSASRVSAPELNASDCIDLGDSKSEYGPGFKNSCPYQVVFRFCAYKPLPDAWSGAFDCEKTAGGTEIIGAKQRIAAHTADAEMIYWGGCRHPEGSGTDFEFVPGVGYRFNCMAWQNGQVKEVVTKRKVPACDVADVAQDAAVELEVKRLRAEIPRLIAEAKQDQAETRERHRQKELEWIRRAENPKPQQPPIRTLVPGGESLWRCSGQSRLNPRDRSGPVNYSLHISENEVRIRSLMQANRDTIFSRRADGSYIWVNVGPLLWGIRFEGPNALKLWNTEYADRADPNSATLNKEYRCERQGGSAQAESPPSSASSSPSAPRPQGSNCTGSVDLCNDQRNGWPPGTTLCMRTGGRNCLSSRGR